MSNLESFRPVFEAPDWIELMKILIISYNELIKWNKEIFVPPYVMHYPHEVIDNFFMKRYVYVYLCYPFPHTRRGAYTQIPCVNL